MISFISQVIMKLCCMVGMKNSVTILGISLLSIIILSSSGFVSQNAFATSVTDFFWSEDDGTGEIFTADSATKTVTPITSGGFVRIDDVEVDPLTGNVWWNNWIPGPSNAGSDEGIYRSNLDGTGQVQSQKSHLKLLNFFQ